MAESLLLEHPIKYVEWHINKFLDIPNTSNYKLESSQFTFTNAKWFLQIYPNGQTWNSSGNIGLYLNRLCFIQEQAVIFRIGIQKTDGSELKSFEVKRNFSVESSGWGYADFVQRSELWSASNVLTPEGALTVFCTLRVENKPLEAPTAEYVSQAPLSEGIMTLIGGLKDLYVNRRHTDVTITVKAKEFQAHRIVLSARSKVFASMFEHDMEEKNNGTIEIADCEPDIFEQFLLFLYAGKFEIVTSNNMMNLYKIADKYDVHELKQECIRRMDFELSTYTFCDILHLSTMQNEAGLLKSVTEFFINNAQSIVTTTKWHDYLQEHPLVGNELFFQTFKL